MTLIRIRTPSRLHFGLLAWGPDAPRQFGGVGLMIDAPGIELSAQPASSWSAEGLLAERVRRVAEQVAGRLSAAGVAVSPAHFRVSQAPSEHVGLGVGTQLSLAVTEALLALSGRFDPWTARLAEFAGRGLRSGIGLHGYERGGLLVDGGRRSGDHVAPLLAHLPFPSDWSVVVVVPERAQGLHGPEERDAFAQLPPVPERTTDRLCGLVLLGLLPAAIERDLRAFGSALTELQDSVGRCFSPAQGGVYAYPELASVVRLLRSEGLQGVGQSSWGPALYGFLEGPPEAHDPLLRRLRDRLILGPSAVFATSASPQGRLMEIRSLPESS